SPSRATRRFAGSRATSRPTRSIGARSWERPPNDRTASPTSAWSVADGPARARGAATPEEDGRGSVAPQAGQPVADAFDRDTAVRRLGRRDPAGSDASRARFAAEVSSDWRAGRGPHGGYLAAMLLRALTETVAEPERSPRSLTIHYARAPTP